MRGEDGSLIIFSLFLLIMMLMVAGCPSSEVLVPEAA